MNVYNGITIMDSVEIYDCSQANTFFAALRFEGNSGSYSTISNTSIHNGFGWGVSIILSENIVFFNNMIFGFRPIGFGV